MSQEFEIRQIPGAIPRLRRQAEQLLADCGLKGEIPSFYIGAYDCDDNLLAGAGMEGNVVKCVAVREDSRGESLVNTLFSRLLQRGMEQGHRKMFVFTAPKNRQLFESLAMHFVGGGDHAILLESDPHGIGSYCETLRELSSQCPGEKRGAVVMNCNPLTLGHHHLIKEAAKEVDRLFVIPVMEDKSVFTYEERLDMIRRCCAQLDNVTVCPGSDYIISAATFPSYFLKELSDTAKAHIQLDCDIFSRHVAPALGVTVRFVGTEPHDPLTALYNEWMCSHMDVEVRLMERYSLQGKPVSASSLRARISDPALGNPLRLAHPASYPYVLARMAARAMTAELETTPKPGLVDLHDTGAHKDMDADTMRRGIRALLPYFTLLAQAGRDNAPVNEIRRIGLDAEEAMLTATKGVNTHRGSLFCLGLMTCAAARILASTTTLTEATLSGTIATLAAGFTQPEGTHGDMARRKGCVNGALAQARTGYRQLFDSWLPAYRAMKRDPWANHKTLLLIMTTLDDSNVAYRAGVEAIDFVKTSASGLARDFDPDSLARLNGEFIRRGISPGGAADMLSLTLLAHAILT